MGRPSELFGTEVVAVVQLRPDSLVTPNDIRETAAEIPDMPFSVIMTTE